MRCFACNTTTRLASGERIGFRDTCDHCDADLHVCRNCAHHDPSAYNECRESSAERVLDHDRANRCDYFAVGEGGGSAVESARRAAKTDLDSLFKK